MKLSEAIKKGRELGIPQTRGTLFEVHWTDDEVPVPKVCGACALGQAYLGYYGLEAVYKMRINSDDDQDTANDRMYQELESRIRQEFGIPNSYLEEIEAPIVKCLNKGFGFDGYSITGAIVSANDAVRMDLDQIIETLEGCEL